MPPARYARTVVAVQPPGVNLVDAATGSTVRLTTALARDRAVVLQFVFASCTTVCPVMSATLAAAQAELAALPGGVRIVSISIDPAHDTPARLREYARSLGAGPQWTFLTGEDESVESARKSFGAWVPNKASHAPLTFLRAAQAPDAPPLATWVRLDGLPSAAELVAEVRSLATGGAAGGADEDPLGRRIYREGILPSGEPLRGTVAGDVPVAGAAASCAGCHRRSGWGSLESAAYVPPVTAAALFSPRAWPQGELYGKLWLDERAPLPRARLRDPRPRPAYDEAALARALRAGIDAAGAPLDPLMPRYALGEDELAHLSAYLRTLDATPAPGVDASAIHLATVVGADVEVGRRRAMLDVMRAYVDWKNADTARLLRRRDATVWSQRELGAAARPWVLHVWELSGPVETWGEQLAARYRDEPVFALVSGIVRGPWQPVHDFCEREEVPCLFPNTDLPVEEPPGAYTLYLARGLAAEAEALAEHLLASGAGARDGAAILAVSREGEPGTVAAGALRAALLAAGIPLRERVLVRGETATPALWRALLAETRPTTLVLWLGDADVAGLGGLGGDSGAAAGIEGIVLSARLLEEAPPPTLSSLRPRLLLTSPFALPQAPAPHAARLRAWLRARGVKPADQRIQAATFLALQVADHSLERLAGTFSRDAFVERVEHETEGVPNPGPYPRLALGPGLRFASPRFSIIRP